MNLKDWPREEESSSFNPIIPPLQTTIHLWSVIEHMSSQYQTSVYLEKETAFPGAQVTAYNFDSAFSDTKDNLLPSLKQSSYTDNQGISL